MLQIMLMKVTTLMAALLGPGVAVAEVSNYVEPFPSPYAPLSSSSYDPVQHAFGVRQDGIDIDIAGSYIASLGVVNPILNTSFKRTQSTFN